MKHETTAGEGGGGRRNSVGREIHLSGNDGGAARRKNGFFGKGVGGSGSDVIYLDAVSL